MWETVSPQTGAGDGFRMIEASTFKLTSCCAAQFLTSPGLSWSVSSAEVGDPCCKGFIYGSGDHKHSLASSATVCVVVLVYKLRVSFSLTVH